MKDRHIFFLFLILVALVLVWGVVYPNLTIIITSLQRDNNWTLANYRDMAASLSIIRAAWNSFWISLATVIGSALVGGGLALFFNFYDFPGRRLFAALLPLPLVLPPLIGVLAFIFLYGESGIVSRAIIRGLALTGPPWRLNGAGAILAVHIYSMYAYFYIFVSAGLQRIDFSLWEAARTLGAKPTSVFIKVLLPLLRPALVGASLLTFMNSMASFSAPYLFGGGTPMLTLQIFNAKVSNQWGLAMAESVVLALLSLSALLWLERQQQNLRGGSKGVTLARRSINSGPLRLLAIVGGLIVMVLLLLPPLTLLLMSFVKDGSWTMQILPTVYTLDNYRKVFSSTTFATPLSNSLIMSVVAAVADLLIAVPTAYLLIRSRFHGQKLLSILILIPWALPGTVLGLSFMASFNRPTIMTGGIVLVGTFWILPIIYFLRNLPLVVRSTQASLQQFDETLESASRSLGASFWYTLRRVVLPLIWPGALSGTALAFANGMGEFVASILVYVPASRPISVEIAAQLRDFRVGSAAVYGVILMAFIAISLLATWRQAGLSSESFTRST
ncbi:MAG: iron ABC transporter permease [Acidobacteriota bacterium]